MRATECALCLVVAACSANDDVPAPLVSSVVPDRAPAGALVTVNGDYFCQLPGDMEDPLCDTVGQVQFGAAPGTPSLWSETQIMVEVPQGIAGDVPLTVIALGRASNAITFTAQ
jgi:hypothetical protein